MATEHIKVSMPRDEAERLATMGWASIQPYAARAIERHDLDVLRRRCHISLVPQGTEMPAELAVVQAMVQLWWTNTLPQMVQMRWGGPGGGPEMWVIR